MPDFLEDGMIYKSASVEVSEITESEMRKINKLTLSPLSAEEVFTFKVYACDNELDDKNYEPFNLQALKDLKNLFIGKTVIKDHRRSADNQVARVYDSELITEPKITGANEPFTKLLLKCYMVKTASNADLIAEIKGGIKKEVSTGTRAKKAICSICGTDNSKSYCSHWPGREYDTADGKKMCYITLDGAKEAYELSLVAVPAQPRAGATKNYGAAVKEEQLEQQNEKNKEKNSETEVKDLEVDLAIKSLRSFLFLQNMEGNFDE